MRDRLLPLLLGLLLGLLLAACGTPRTLPPGPSPIERDGPQAVVPPDLLLTPDPIPRVEPIRPGGPNKPYEIEGQRFEPITHDQPFKERGLASWYGRKFHGRPTANGETYNMYAMSAAHKTLPLPSFVRVRNPANGREVIVRVNDRGPFARGRVIDLSYTAALKLDLLRGVAPVEIERITFDEIRAGLPTAVPDAGTLATVPTLAGRRRGRTAARRDTGPASDRGRCRGTRRHAGPVAAARRLPPVGRRRGAARRAGRARPRSGRPAHAVPRPRPAPPAARSAGRPRVGATHRAAPAGRGRSERAAGAALNGAAGASQAVAECAKAARRGSAGRKGDDSMDAIHVGRR
jgi:rare lipoprotein A (peptidoglycan hydrolase)